MRKRGGKTDGTMAASWAAPQQKPNVASRLINEGCFLLVSFHCRLVWGGLPVFFAFFLTRQQPKEDEPKQPAQERTKPSSSSAPTTTTLQLFDDNDEYE